MNGHICSITDRGFFFIRGEDGQQYFAHKSGLLVSRWIYDIQDNDPVTFIPTQHEKGPRAEGIVVTRLHD